MPLTGAEEILELLELLDVPDEVLLELPVLLELLEVVGVAVGVLLVPPVFPPDCFKKFFPLLCVDVVDVDVEDVDAVFAVVVPT